MLECFPLDVIEFQCPSSSHYGSREPVHTRFDLEFLMFGRELLQDRMVQIVEGVNGHGHNDQQSSAEGHAQEVTVNYAGSVVPSP